MSSFSITYKFPVSRHVYKYLVCKTGTDNAIATRKNFVGSILLCMLSPNEDLEHETVKDSKVFKVTVHDEFYLQNGQYISPKIANAFNSVFDKCFREELFSHCFCAKIKCEDTFLNAMRAFMKEYRLTEDDFELDSLYRDFKRRKTEREHFNTPQLELLFTA